MNNTSAQIGGNYAAPSGTFEYGGAINVDLSSLFVNWYGVDFHEGKMVSGTVDSGGQFTLNWTSDTDWEIDNPAHTYGGSSWTWVGQVSELNTVPAPAALWLLGSGLAGLMAVARCRISA